MIARKTSVDSTYTYYTTEQTSFTEMSIAPDITYTYQVRAAYATEHNGTAYGAWSTSRSVSASAKPELTVSNKTGGVDVNWEPVAGATRYTLYYKETGTADWSSLELRDTGYLFMELTPGVNYSFQLRALNGLSNPFSAIKPRPGVSLPNGLRSPGRRSTRFISNRRRLLPGAVSPPMRMRSS